MKETAFQAYIEAVHSAGNSEDCSHFFMKLAEIVLIPRIDCYEKYFPILARTFFKAIFKIFNQYYFYKFLIGKDEEKL